MSVNCKLLQLQLHTTAVWFFPQSKKLTWKVYLNYKNAPMFYLFIYSISKVKKLQNDKSQCYNRVIGDTNDILQSSIRDNVIKTC